MKFSEYYFDNVRTDVDGFLISNVTYPDGVIEKDVVITSAFYKCMKNYAVGNKLDVTLFDKINFQTFKVLLGQQ